MTVRTAGAASMVEAIRARRDKGKESIARDAMQDRRLSMKARGILAYLISKPDKWRTNADAIASACDKDGREAIANGLKELEQFGYLVRIRRHGSGGQWCWCWVYSDDPTEVAEFVASMDDLGNQARRGRVKAPSPDAAMNGKPDPGEPDDEAAMNGFPEDGSPVDGKPVDIEVQEIDLPPLPPAQRGESDASPEPEQPEPTARPRCQTHNRSGCRECGLSARSQAQAERKAADEAEASRLAAIRACRMCDADGRRWQLASRCDHVMSPLAARAEQDARDEAIEAAKSATPEREEARLAKERGEQALSGPGYAAARAAVAGCRPAPPRRSSRRKVAVQASAGGGG